MKFRVALAQTQPILFDKQSNVQIAEEWMARAAREKAQVVIFPELFLTGYAIGDRIDEMGETVHGKYVTQLAQAARANKIALVMGFAEKEEQTGRIYDASFFCDAAGRISGTYRKVHLYSSEKQWFSRGAETCVWPTDYEGVGALICYDLEFPEHARILTLKGARWLAACTGNMKPNERAQQIFVQARAMENRVWVALSNRLGVEGEIEFFGGSVICDPMGNIVASGAGEAALVVADIDLERNEQAISEDTDYLADRWPDAYRELILEFENRK